MSEASKQHYSIPPEQQAIRDKCFHPSGSFLELPKQVVEQSVPQLFEKIAKQYSQRIAVKSDKGGLTYEALKTATQRVSCAISKKLGDRVEPVVILSGPDIRTIISCLAVLKAGKILVAVDTAYPLERINRTIDDCQAQIILTGNRDLSLARKLANTPRGMINTDQLDEMNADNTIELSIPPDTPAEIRYTSGSTGEPKGIVRSHRRLLHSAMSSINSARICPEDRILVLKNMSFGVRNVLRGLLSGAGVFPFDIARDGFSKLASLLLQEKITMCAMVSTAFRRFTRELHESERFPSMRLIQVAGERLTRNDVESFKKHFSPDCILLHTLSSGESGNICQYFIDHQSTVSTTIVPAGYPINGKEVLILDDKYQTLGCNEIGEIAVRSRYLSSEYWGNSNLTELKFLSDPNGGDNRIYLTGDIGRMLSDGCIVHLGRKDLDVKIRGNRVAIPEIEAVLLDHFQIADVAVKALQDRSGEAYLAAYVVPVREQQLKSSELMDYLKTRLPDHMIPTRFVFLTALPTVNGKLDRQALPASSNSRPELETLLVAPRTALEKELAKIWCDALSLDVIGVNDHFVDLGGHSLAAMSVVSQVLRTFQLELSLESLFQSPTIAKMAAIITDNQTKRASEVELAQMLREVEAMTELEAQEQLARTDDE